MKAIRYPVKTILLSLLMLSLPITSVLAGFNPSAGLEASPAATADDPIPVLACEGVGSQPASVADHGLRFTPGQDFDSLELRLAASNPGVYQFNLEIRRSQNFTGPADYTIFAEGNLPPQDAFPYQPVEVSFNTIPITPTATLTVKIVPLSGAGGQMVFESFGQGNNFCAGMSLTNSLANPSLVDWGAPAGFKLYNKYTGQYSIPSKYTTTPPTLDGFLGVGEWNLSSKLSFQKGFISVMNDTLRLYVLIDVLSDYGNDPDDQFTVSFDVNHDGAITSLVDKNYALTPTQNMRFQYYTGPGTFTAFQPETYSARARGFGCFNADLTASYTWPPTQNTYCNQHTLFELAFDLDEISSNQGQDAALGFSVASPVPAINLQFPSGYPTNFGKLIKIDLDPMNFPPGIPDPNLKPGLVRSVFNSAAEITQATQKPDNSVRLVNGKRTVGRVYARSGYPAQNQEIKVFLYGSLSGIDLPGSPQARLFLAKPAPQRANLSDTANFQLPTSWAAGLVSFQAKTKGYNEYIESAPAFEVGFWPTRVPTYWIYPINTSTQSMPVLPTSQAILNQTSALKAYFPVRDAILPTYTWQAIGPVPNRDDLLGRLNLQWNNIQAAWSQSQSFTLPDQIYGFPNLMRGLSDPTWLNGRGRVAFGSDVQLTLSHEINHNMDRSSNGTWGRHVDACGAGGPDPNWPYGKSPNINEFGFDTRLPWQDTNMQVSVVPTNFPDPMSYCADARIPLQWTEPYRWENQLSTFSTSQPQPLALDASANTYYITGVVNQNGSGSLDPLFQMPGTENDSGIPTGDYSIELFNSASGGVVKSLYFNASFTDTEGEARLSAPFNFHVQVPAGSLLPDLVRLKKGSLVLHTLSASSGLPNLTFTAPAAGVTWSGQQTLQWTASDSNSDALTFNLWYSPDQGTNWFPVSAGLTGSAYTLDLSTLPGGSAAIFRMIASDGFNTTATDSPIFNVPNNPPYVQITAPANGLSAPQGTLLELAGQAQDPEQEALPSSSFFWFLDGQPLGKGEKLLANLPTGSHTLRLAVIDSQGAVGYAEISFSLTTRLFLPVVVR